VYLCVGRSEARSVPTRVLRNRLGGPEGLWRRREGDEKRVTLRVDLDTASSGTPITHDPPVLGERLRVGLGAEPVQELGRTLDVGEEEGDCPRR
jgi:hypothetical protein